MSRPKHKASMDKSISSFDWGRQAGLRLADLGRFAEALNAHHKPLLPRQRLAFERGYRQGVKEGRAALYNDVELGDGYLEHQQQDGTWKRIGNVTNVVYSTKKVN